MSKKQSLKKEIKETKQKKVVEKKGVFNNLKRFWNFLWYEDSILSWMTLIILAFILIKFVFYPGIGILLGTNFPIVAVVSSSMEHHPANFDQWWDLNQDFYLKFNITKQEFQDFKFRKGFNKGDIMLLRGVDPHNMKKGTIMVYWSKKPYPIIHRYIGNNTEENKTNFLMSKGDNGLTNPWFIQQTFLNEKEISPNSVVGQAFLRIPYLGYVKIWATELVGGMIN